MIHVLGFNLAPLDPSADPLHRWVRYAILPNGGGLIESSATSPEEATRNLLRHISLTAVGPLDWTSRGFICPTCHQVHKDLAIGFGSCPDCDTSKVWGAPVVNPIPHIEWVPDPRDPRGSV